MKLFPFKDGCDAMQRALVGHLNDPNYAFSLPNLASHSWNLILNDRQEMERLEFLGDALIGAFVSEELLRLRPNEGPGFYTNARMVLTANSTFAQIMSKAGFHNIQDPIKPAGDAYETILATYHAERGPTAFQEYLRQYFTPLIETATKAYYTYRTNAKAVRQKKKQNRSVTANILHHAKSHRKQLKKVPNMKKRDRLRPSKTLVDRKRHDRAPILIDLTIDSDDDMKSEVEVQELLAMSPVPEASSPGAIVPKVELGGLATALKSSKSQSEQILRAIAVSPPKLSKKTFKPTPGAPPLPRLPLVISKLSSTKPFSSPIQASGSVFGVGSIESPIIID